jgi:hypothetical protein
MDPAAFFEANPMVTVAWRWRQQLTAGKRFKLCEGFFSRSKLETWVE